MSHGDPDDASITSVTPLDPYVIVLFGATGDLARKKLLPGLVHLSRSGLLPDYRIVATSLDDLTPGAFRDLARAAWDEAERGPVTSWDWDAFASRLTYVDTRTGAGVLADAVAAARTALGADPRNLRYLHYLSVPPAAAGFAGALPSHCRRAAV